MHTSKGSAARVGFVAFIATLVVVVAVFMIGDGRSFFQEQIQYNVFFPSTSGLRVDARVFISGVLVGNVAAIDFPKDLDRREIEVTLAIQSKYADLLRTDSIAWIQSEGLLGDKVMNLRLGDPAKPKLPPKGTIKSVDRSALADLVGSEIMAGTNDLMENMLSLLREVNAGEGTLGQLLRNPDLYDNMNEFTRSIAAASNELAAITRDSRGILQELRAQKGTLGKLIFSEQYEQDFGHALQGANTLIDDLERIAGPVSRGEGSLGRLLKEDTIHKDLDEALVKVSSAAGRLDGILRDMDQSQSALARIVKDPSMGRDLERLVQGLTRGTEVLESVLRKVDAGEGSAGMFVNDPSLFASLRDIFLGVQEGGILKSLARRAEETGRAIALRDLHRQVDAGRKEMERSRTVPGEPDEGRPVPAALKDGGKPVPAPAQGSTAQTKDEGSQEKGEKK